MSTSHGGFDAFYRDTYSDFVGVAYLIVGSRSVAEELVQEAYTVAWQRFDELERPGGFLRTTLVRKCLDWHRRSTTERRVLGEIGEPEPTGIPEIDEMWDLVEDLRPEWRTAVVLRFRLDMTHSEIGDVMGTSPVTARTRLHRALNDLRRKATR